MEIDQEANFNYLTGCLVPDATVFITFNPSHSDPSSSSIKHELYIPPADPLVTMWSVAPPTLDEARSKFDSDVIAYTSDLPGRLSGFKGTTYTLPTTMEYPAFLAPVRETLDGLRGEQNDNVNGLRTALHRARMEKTEYEIELIREANRISSGAHEVLMRELGRYAKRRQAAGDAGGKEKERTGKEGITEWEVESEGDAEALFLASCRRMGWVMTFTDEMYGVMLIAIGRTQHTYLSAHRVVELAPYIMCRSSCFAS